MGGFAGEGFGRSTLIAGIVHVESVAADCRDFCRDNTTEPVAVEEDSA